MAPRVIIVDDHGFTLSGMQRLFAEAGFDVVGTAPGGIEGIALGRRLRPDLAVLDFAMPDATGLEVFAELSRWSPDTRCAIVTGETAPGLLRQLAEAGVHGVFTKATAPADILAGLRLVVQGERVLPALPAAPAEVLSMREIEVLQGIARGLTNAGIAEALAISPKTVETHRASLMRKLGVHSTAALLVKAMRDRLIPI